MLKLLDCTLRDGAYIVEAKFGISAIRGIVNKLQDAGVDIIECGWLKDNEHVSGTTYYHVPSDFEQYLLHKDSKTIYVAMIDWNRYDVTNLPPYDGRSIDAVRVVFPHEHYREGIAVGAAVQKKGYKVYFQAANTLAYSGEELKELASLVNEVKPEGLAIVDTFGAMYEDDLDRIAKTLDENLDTGIGLGFHSHNNQQMAFANCIYFAQLIAMMSRDGIIDASLNGMGRGAGNATTELVANYLNNKLDGQYSLDSIMDAIDVYMEGFSRRYTWGYSTANYIAGIYCCHVNNIAYLQNNHRTSFHDMRQIIESLPSEDRKLYDYDLLEEKYISNQDRQVDDDTAISSIIDSVSRKGKVLLVAPGRSSVDAKETICEFITENKPLIIGVNALLEEYKYDYLFITNKARYEYARTTHIEAFASTPKILLSNIKTTGGVDEQIVNYSRAIKRGWKHFDNAVICCLRLLNQLGVTDVYLAGFDGFKNDYNLSYADKMLPTLNPEGKWDELNAEIIDMYRDVKNTASSMRITFITESIFNI